ncbi:MAG: aldehyde dehydrogenase [Prolixibacteraceae bacterium]|jgi:aldehyde dehydrogenase (NAD+)|nr:aldehyde dehydrogenase [Prolixibacteraceae bacterium]
MEDSSRAKIESLVSTQRALFKTHATKDLEFRIGNLKKFRSAILKYETRIADALWLDLHKSPEEVYLTETSIVLGEIDCHLKHLRSWASPKSIPTPLPILPSSSRILYEPLGTALIIAPWNYPFQMLLNPLVGAISSGCCALLKPSPYTPNIAKVMEELVAEIFDPAYIAMVQGGREVNQILLEQRFDVIFFTGSPTLGKIVMQAAAKFLTPVVLELGGKSPCIMDAGANIKLAARRIAWGKCINAGQTCIAPDYLFVHQSVKERLVREFAIAVEGMYGKVIKESRYFPRIVNAQAVERLQKLMQHGKISYGGEVDVDQKFIAPTIIEDVRADFPIMQEEIFGPLLPVITFEKLDSVVEFINSNEKPLAFYYFGPEKVAREILIKTTSGGGCINDTLIHIANHRLPFGGVGNSGMGNYHGKFSFQAFSHARGIVSSVTWIDLPFKYPPFKFFKWVKKIL